MKKDKIIYWVVTGLFSAWMLMQGIMFTFNSGQISELFESLGIPTSLIIPLGVAKLLGIAAILLKKSDLLKKLAYVGFGIDFLVAIFSHLRAGDGNWMMPTIALLLMVVSFIYDRKLFK